VYSGRSTRLHCAAFQKTVNLNEFRSVLHNLEVKLLLRKVDNIQTSARNVMRKLGI
jgi:hypothetical protein